MLFLAVFCGFLTENVREHLVEKHRENKYIATLAKELKYDCEQYDTVMANIHYISPVLDSLYYNAKNAGQFNYRLLAKWNTPANEVRIPYYPPLPTIQELKSSGNLRLIEKSAIEQKIMVYDGFVESSLKNSGDAVIDAAHKVYAYEDRFCDYTDFNKSTSKDLLEPESQKTQKSALKFEMPILVKDPLTLNEFANSFVNYRAHLYGYYTSISQTKQIAMELLQLIKKEYHIE